MSPQQIREILQLENKDIKGLCKQVSLMPKKDNTGKIYFSKDDVEVLKKVKSLHARSQELMKKTETLGQKRISTASSEVRLQPQKQLATQPTASPDTLVAETLSTLVTSLTNLQDNIIDKVSGVIDDKLDGMDEVVVELIRCKTENEALRQKINELNKENYNLKTHNNSFRKIVPGLYVKRSSESFML